MDWWRSWHGAPTDAKWLVVARWANVPPGMVSAIAWALLDYASQNDERGSIAGFDVETYAVWSGFTEEQIEAVIEAMRAKKNVLDGDRFVNWEKRQPKREDPGGTQRQRDKRERDKEKEKQGNTENALPCVTSRDKALPSVLILSKSVSVPQDGVKGGDDAPIELDPDFALVCNVYHEKWGDLDPNASNWIKELLLLDTAEDIADALRIAAKNEVRTWKYVGGILNNRRNGRNGQGPPKRQKRDPVKRIRLSETGEVIEVGNGT